MLLLLTAVLAQPPVFTVVNKTAPAFTVVNRTKAPEVARPKGNTFRNGDWHTGHDCPQCGRQQLVIASGGKYGPHTHVCSDPRCRTLWRHGG